jgi:hypothetical protein
MPCESNFLLFSVIVKDMALLLEGKLDAGRVKLRKFTCSLARKSNSKDLLDHFKSISQGLFAITGYSEDAVDVSITWGELMEPIMLVIEAVMFCLVIPLHGVSQILPHAIVEYVIGERLGAKLA